MIKYALEVCKEEKEFTDMEEGYVVTIYSGRFRFGKEQLCI